MLPQNSNPERPNRIRMVFHQASFKEALEIIATVNPEECHIKFSRESMSITCVSAVKKQKSKGAAPAELTKRSQVDYKFVREDMIKYDYRMFTPNKEPIRSYECIVNTLEFSKRVKGLNEKIFNMNMIYPTKKGEAPRLEFGTRSTSGTTFLALADSKIKSTHTDHLESWFKGRDPVHRPQCSALVTVTKSVKTNKCVGLEFCVNNRTGTFKVQCWTGSTIVFADPMSDLDDSVYEEDIPSDTYHTRYVDLQQNDWVINIHKLCVGSVANIYIRKEDNSPLIITTGIGPAGRAIFSIPDGTSA